MIPKARAGAVVADIGNEEEAKGWEVGWGILHR